MRGCAASTDNTAGSCFALRRYRRTDGGDERWCWLGSYADESATTDGRLRRLLDTIPLQMGFLNTAMVLEFTNLKSLRDFNMTFEQLEQWTSSGIIHVDDHETNNRHIAALLSGKTYESELRFLYPNGAYRWTKAVCVPMRDAHGNVVCYVTCQVDIDDLKQAEALLAAEVKLLEMVARSEPLAQSPGRSQPSRGRVVRRLFLQRPGCGA